MRAIKFSLIGVLMACVICCAVFNPAQAQRNLEIAESQGMEIDEHLGNSIPLNLIFKDENGKEVKLENYFNRDKPVLMQLVYLNCPMLCTLVVNGTLEALEDNGLEMGRDFEMVTVSFVAGRGETPELALTKKDKYLESYSPKGDPDAWHVLTGERESIDPLVNALGFKYRFVEERNEFAHPAALFLLSADGKIRRYLYGVTFDPQTLKYSLAEAGKGNSLATSERVFLFCFQYDHVSGRYEPVARNIMKAGGAVTLFLVAMLMTALWAAERSRKFNDDEPADGESNESQEPEDG